jgi:hypothetical protein
MSLTYLPGKRQPWTLDPKTLRHRYYVQLTPDQQHVVLGMVQQDTRPLTGQWLQLGTIRRKLAARYFVQQTSINTLVPGSLIQSNTPPGSTWKDIQTQTLDHVLYFTPLPYTVNENSEEVTFATGAEFMEDIVNPALNAVYPNRNPSDPIKIRLYYYMDIYSQYNNDPTTLTPFTTPGNDTGIGYYLTGTSTYAAEINSTDTAPAELIIQPTAPYGYMSFIFAILNDADEVVDYIFINDVVHHFLPG